MEREVSLLAYPRMHFGLIDLGGATPRSYGGAGAAISAYPLRACARAADRFEITADTEPDLQQTIAAAVGRAGSEGLDTSAAVTITDAFPAHVGFGSGTATVLSALVAVARLLRWPVSDNDLVRLSGRGRTSGVGCTTFFCGGFAIDVGQHGHPVDGLYRPSHDPHGRPPSTSVGSWPIPDTWRITLVVPTLKPTVEPAAEGGFFRASTPVSIRDVLQQLAHLYHGMLPALIEANLPAFSASLSEYQRRGFKRAEIDAQPAPVRRFISAAWELGLAAGLSSLGPTAFVIHDRRTTVDEWAVDLNGCSTDGPFQFRNRGAAYEVQEG